MTLLLVLVLVLVGRLLFLMPSSLAKGGGELGAFDQELPDCRMPYTTINKHTSKTALTCAMIRNEEGFLAEWVAYHQMHGFDHIILFDHGSSDGYLNELQPWLITGFVRVYSDWQPILGYDPNTKKTYAEKMVMKSDLEAYCMKKGMEMNIDYFVSLDLDEYIMPVKGMMTVVDAMHAYYEQTRFNVIRLSKLNFQSVPHLLEPVNLLTLEAYHTRMFRELEMTYFKKVMKKLAIQLNGFNYTHNTRQFILKCCSIHGCTGAGDYCKPQSSELAVILPKMKKRVQNSLVIYHYSRSLEKFSMKAKTWETATGDNPRGYNMVHFLDRNVGRHTDRSALRFTCQLRKHLANITDANPFFRQGHTWYRNVEFGRPMTDSEKGKRNKKPVEAGFRVKSYFDDHYFGYYVSFDKYRSYF